MRSKQPGAGKGGRGQGRAGSEEEVSAQQRGGKSIWRPSLLGGEEALEFGLFGRWQRALQRAAALTAEMHSE